MILNKKTGKIKAIIIYFCLIIFLQSASACAEPRENIQENAFEGLKKRLIDDGFDAEKIAALYKNPELLFAISSVSGYFRHNEATLNYDQFKSWDSILKAKNYLKDKKSLLENAEKNYGVDKEVITAILLVETRLGTYTGKNSVLNSLSTMAALADPYAREKLWAEMSENNRFPRDKFDKTADKKSDWAYGELKAYLNYTDNEKVEPQSIQGSYAGAFGISQFIPSSVLKFAKDGNGDGKINLFDHEDAIESTANYLKSFGWELDMPRDKAFEVVYHYNHSEYYVNAILDIVGILKEK